MEKKFQNMFSVSEIMALEHIAEIFRKKWGGYMWSAINVLPNSSEILDLTNRDVFQLNLSWNNGNLW